MSPSRTPRTFTTAAVLAVAALGATSAVASADSLVAAAPGAHNLASGGGYLAWAAPAPGGGFKLTVRAPDGMVSQPAIDTFAAPPDLSIGSARFDPSADRRPLVVAYSRCEGASALSGCDVYSYDLKTGAEQRVAALATRTYSETAVSVSQGNYSFVRRGTGSRKGVYTYSPGHALRQISPRLARETQTNGSRVAFVYTSSRGFGVALSSFSGRGVAKTSLAVRQTTAPSSLQMTRYRAGWLQPVDGGVLATTTSHFGGSGPKEPITLRRANRLLPASTNAFVTDGSFYKAYLDGDGVKTLDPTIFPGA